MRVCQKKHVFCFSAAHEQIHEFLEFKTRLQNSMQYASATVERLLLDMVMETNR